MLQESLFLILMDNLLYFSIGAELVAVFSSLIFIVLLLSTKILPVQVLRFGILLFTNLLFIALFYFFINVSWVQAALPLLWLFVPSTLTVGLFFYRFNSDWLKIRSPFDRYLNWIPWGILIIVGALEILSLIIRDNVLIKDLRIDVTVITMRFLFPLYNGSLIVLNLIKLKQAERTNQNAYSSDEVVNLNWSRISLLFFGLFYIGMILSELVNATVSEIVFNLTLLTLTMYMGYFQIRTIGRYLKITQAAQGIPANGLESEQESGYSKKEDASRLNSLFKELDNLIDGERLYLKEDLTLYDLGQRMSLNPKYLSQAINFQDDHPGS